MQSKWEIWKRYKREEAKLIELVKKAFPLEWENGIGNDGALISPPLGEKVVISQDFLLEGVHFFPHMPPEALAYKSLMVNLSDIFADGGSPQSILLGLQVPNDRISYAKDFVESFIKEAKKYGVRIVGGDTVRSNQWGISIVCLGSVRHPWLRKNAKTGDQVYVTGSLGGSAKGLQLLKEGSHFDFENPWIQRHCYPPYLEPIVRYLVSQDISIHAAVDISDGFLEDFTQILLESEKSCTIFEDSLPIEKGASLSEALWGGEDYELILCSPHFLPVQEIFENTGIKLSHIGEVVDPVGDIGEILSKKTRNILNIPRNSEKFFHF